jgi:hypothetical protein
VRLGRQGQREDGRTCDRTGRARVTHRRLRKDDGLRSEQIDHR